MKKKGVLRGVSINFRLPMGGEGRERAHLDTAPERRRPRLRVLAASRGQSVSRGEDAP
jgi:hypothetical protein